MTHSNSAMRTPLSKVRGLGAAGTGTDHFWHQRITALANLILGLYAVGVVWCLVGHDHAYARHVLGSFWVSVPLALFVVSFCWHMKLGLQVVIEDYVHAEGLKILAIIANMFFCAAVAFAALFALVKLTLGA